MSKVHVMGKDLGAIQGALQPPEVISNLFVRGHLNIIASKPGVGKTWLTLIKARNIANEGMVSLILNGETGYELLLLRAQKLCFSQEQGNRINVLSLSDFVDCGGLMLDDKAGWENFQKAMIAVQPDVVFVDSLLAFISSDESDMKTLRDVFGRLKLTAEKFNSAIVVNHHLRKRSGGSPSSSVAGIDVDDFIGSSVISRYACNMFTVKKTDDGLVTVSCVKSWFKAPNIFSYSLKDRDDGTIAVMSNATSNTIPSYRERVALCLRGQPMSLTALSVALKQRYTTCCRAILRLEKEGFVTSETVDGKKMLRLACEDEDKKEEKESA